jgi:tetratricopeptide (TPR) repeat protein
MQDLQQAIGLHGQGKIAEAERLYRHCLEQDPDQPDALALLGVLLSGKGDHAEALQYLEQAVQRDPQASLFHYYLGNHFAAAGDDAKAITRYREALTRQPDFADAHYGLAVVLQKINENAAAIDALRQTVTINPDYIDAWLKLSNLSLLAGDYQKGLEAAQRAACLQPGNLTAAVAEALALDYLDCEEEAILALKRAIDINAGFSEAWEMLAMTLQKLNRLDEAESVFRQNIVRFGCDLPDESDIKTAEENYSRYHWNLALLELLRGDFHNGFAHYRARFKFSSPQLRLPALPVWHGEALAGKKILVMGEQGLGDVLMFCRYGGLLRSQGAHVTFLVHDQLVSLLSLTNLADILIVDIPGQTQGYDYQTSMFDLPYVLGTTLETIPDNVPYLPTPGPTEATQIPDAPAFNVGIVWAGRQSYGNNRRRSIKLEMFAPLFHNSPEIEFYSLMRDASPEDKERLAHYGVTDLSPRLMDFLATAQIIGQLDLVITCDTSVAHLAGGMGKPVWLLLPFAPDWRWLMGRDDSPWYPTMRLFRQRQKTDWRDVIERVRDELQLMLNTSCK